MVDLTVAEQQLLLRAVAAAVRGHRDRIAELQAMAAKLRQHGRGVAP